MRQRFFWLPTYLPLTLLVLTAVAACGCGRGTKDPKTAAADAQRAAEEFSVVDNSMNLPVKTPKPLDVSYIPTDAVVAFVFDPYQLLEAPNVMLVKPSQLPQLVQSDLGLELSKIEQLTVLGGLGKKLGEYFLGSIVRFKQPTDEQQLLYTMGPEWTDASEADHKYHRAKDSDQCACFIDSKTLLLANEETLKKMLAADKEADSPLLTTLCKSDDSAAVLGVVEVAAIRPQVMTFLLFNKLPSPFDQPPLDTVKEVPKNVDEAVLKFVVSPLANISVNLVARNDEAAVATDTFISNVVEKIGEQVDSMAGDDGNPAVLRCKRCSIPSKAISSTNPKPTKCKSTLAALKCRTSSGCSGR